jgi:hypothetical protein
MNEFEAEFKIEMDAKDILTALQGECNNYVDSLINNEAFLHLPIMYGPDSDGAVGKTPENALTVHLAIMEEHHAKGKSNVLKSFDMREAIRRDIEDYVVDGNSWGWGLRRMRDDLRAMASEIDEALHRKENP